MPADGHAQIKLVSFHKYSQQIRAVREAVFISELGITPELEWDTLDESARYAVAINNGKVIAVARLTEQGKIGRMAVLPDWRHQGIGRQLMHCLIQAATQSGLQKIILSSQLDAKGFYQKLGFKSEGSPFLAAGISHQNMFYQCKQNAV